MGVVFIVAAAIVCFTVVPFSISVTTVLLQRSFKNNDVSKGKKILRTVLSLFIGCILGLIFTTLILYIIYLILTEQIVLGSVF